MHYYQFNIGDYSAHTMHLDELEDLAYRRMLDYCYLNEIGLPDDVEQIARLIRMRTHCERIANVLQEFFVLHSDGVWRQARIQKEIDAFHDKSDKAKKAARKRWGNGDADAMRPHSEGNAKHKTLTINHKPIEREAKRARFKPPTVDEVSDYLTEKNAPSSITAERFMDYYEANGWMINGKSKMKNWKAAVRTWISRENDKPHTPTPPSSGGGSTRHRTLTDDLHDTSWAKTS